ncbi:MAG TPA: TlpA disulfide reductase family protein [Opitutus sp.]|nr:TlpA disulfide reductase family protein [Opitutus sp.]
MKTKTAFLAVAALVLAGAIQAADLAPAKPAGAEELTAVMNRVSTKIEGGTRDAAGLADEFKALDALVAAHKSDDPETAAEALFMEARIRLQFFEDDKGAAVELRRIVSEFPKSLPAGKAAQLVEAINQHQESERIAAALKPGTEFPDFKEQDVDGKPLSLAQYRGKVVLVDFWATWCGPCVGELPNVLAAYQKYHPKGFEIVGISLDDDQGKLEGFTGAKGMSWRQYFDGQGWGNKLAKRYGVTAIPATYLLDRDGKIVAKDLRGPALETELARLLGE